VVANAGIFLKAKDDPYLLYRGTVLPFYAGDSSSARTFPLRCRPRDVLCGLNLGIYLSSVVKDSMEVATPIFV